MNEFFKMNGDVFCEIKDIICQEPTRYHRKKILQDIPLEKKDVLEYLK